MRRSRFSYDLPGELIAQHPAEPRDAARLLCLDRRTGALSDETIAGLPARLNPGDLMVFNDTKVIPARLFGKKESGGRVEILVERLLDDHRALAQLRVSKPPSPGGRIILEGGDELEVLGREADFFVLQSSTGRPLRRILGERGHVPLPPYIRREDAAVDHDRYQTMFAKHEGAVAAPTAGLHFTPELIGRLGMRGVATAFITLHVGAGTFQPLRVEEIEEHRMHGERFEVTDALCAAVAKTRRAGGRIVAVGTTTVRALESAGASGTLEPRRGDTDIFVRPGYEFRIVDALLTNFHLPESTLIMLVAAFGGIDPVLRAYEHAVAARYRFYSYGDAMLIA